VPWEGWPLKIWSRLGSKNTKSRIWYVTAGWDIWWYIYVKQVGLMILGVYMCTYYSSMFFPPSSLWCPFGSIKIVWASENSDQSLPCHHWHWDLLSVFVLT
jgi:hypothetical protein